MFNDWNYGGWEKIELKEEYLNVETRPSSDFTLESECDT